MKNNFNILFTMILVIGIQSMAVAQRKYDIPKYKVSDGTKVVLVVNSNSGQVEDLVMFSKLKKEDAAPNKTYYAGVLYGKFSQTPNKKLP